LFLEQLQSSQVELPKPLFGHLGFCLGHARWATPHQSDAQENPLPIEIHCKHRRGEIFALRMIMGSGDAR